MMLIRYPARKRKSRVLRLILQLVGTSIGWTLGLNTLAHGGFVVLETVLPRRASADSGNLNIAKA